MIVTVTPNPALDRTIEVERMTPNGTHRTPPALERAGGKGLNVSRVLDAQGVETFAIAPVGEADAGGFASDLGGVPHHFVLSSAPTRRSTAIVETSTGVTTIFNESGTAQPVSVWRTLAQATADRAASADVLVVSGSVPPGAPDDLVAGLVLLGAAAGVPVIADASGAQMIGAARAGAAVLKPNRLELSDATGQDDPVAGARALQRLGAGLVVVSLGEEGMIGVPSDPDAPVLAARLDRVLHGNPTGAGDAAVAAIASLLARDGATATEALLVRAVAWSAAAVLEPVAGSIHPDHEAFERDVTVTTLSAP